MIWFGRNPGEWKRLSLYSPRPNPYRVTLIMGRSDWLFYGGARRLEQYTIATLASRTGRQKQRKFGMCTGWLNVVVCC